MKLSSTFTRSFLCLLTVSAALSLDSRADDLWAPFLADPTQQPIMQVTTDARPGLQCNLSVILTQDNQLSGATYNCTGAPVAHPNETYTLDQLRQSVVLYHDDGHNIDVVILSAPQLDAIHGGAVNVHYLYNAVTKEYRDFALSIEPQGTNWVAYTSNRVAFNTMFLPKHTVLGVLVGIQEIDTSWTQRLLAINP